MNKKYLVELLKFSSPYSILVVTWNNELIELHTPFKILVKHNIGELKEGNYASVSMVKLSTNLITVYIINGGAFNYYHFEIII